MSFLKKQTNEEIRKKILEYIVENKGYRISDIGNYVFGIYKYDDGILKIPYSSQAHALMISKHLKKLEDEKILYRKIEDSSKCFLWFKLS